MRTTTVQPALRKISQHQPLPIKGQLTTRQGQPSSPDSPLIQRKSNCACGGSCPRCQDDLPLQTKLKISVPDSNHLQTQQSEIAPEVSRVLAKPGQPMHPKTRTFFEQRFGHDLSGVRIHRDSQATAAAQRLNAAAFTVGQTIVFDHQFYHPDSVDGLALMAHELVHTLQQKSFRRVNTDSARSLSVSQPQDQWELEADTFAHRVMNDGIQSAAQPVNTPVTPTVSPMLARTNCSRLPYRSCTTGVYKCGYGGSGTCGWVGPSRGGCICVGASRPSVQRVLEVLLIIGVSILLIATIIAALLDPEPVSKLALAGLSAAQISLLLVMLGYEEPGESGPTASQDIPNEDEMAA